MSRPRSAGSFFWGLILIAAGSIFLLNNLGYDVRVWAGIARYWPVLLIVWGFVKLIDYARLKRSGESGPLFSAGEVVLLIVVIMAGSAMTAAANMSPDLASFFEIANLDIWDITGNSYHFTEHQEKEVPSGSSIEIFNRYGNVEIVPADTDRIVVDVDKTVIAANEAEAAKLSKEFVVYSIVGEGSRYQVISNYNRDENRVRGRRFKTSLVVKVPKRSAIVLDNRNGNVDLSGLTGDQKITNVFGNVTLTGIAGAVSISNRDANVTVHEIGGATTITNEAGNVEVRKVVGTLDLRDRNGNVEVEDVKGDTKITHAFGDIVIRDIQGSLEISARHTQVEVSRVEKDVVVDNQLHHVRIDDARGSVKVTNKQGNVDVRFDQTPLKNVQVDSQFGDVTVALPASSTFSIDARTRFGSASSDFPELKQDDNQGRSSITGRVGAGGPDIRIDNRNGSIRIEK
jgi:hypothetical protein